jgi:acyl dehydratase
MRYFEEVQIGDKAEFGAHTFTAEEIKVFARKFDPQPFHLDEAAAARSHFGALCASGWHTVALWMRLAVLHHRAADEARRTRGEPVARIGASPGFRDLKWLKPVYVGDTIRYATELIEKRVSNSRPEWGLIFNLNTGTNQAGERVLSFIGSGFLERRPGG